VLRVAMVCGLPHRRAEAFGGVQIASLNLAEGLAAYDDIDLHIISIGRLPPTVEQWQDPPCTVHRIRAGRPRFLTCWNVTRWGIAAKTRELGADVLHAQGLAALVGPRPPAPSVLTVHGIDERRAALDESVLVRVRSPFLRWAEARARRRYPHVISTTPYVLDEVGHQLTGQVYPIDNAVASVYFDIERREVPGRVLYLGRIRFPKNVHGLVDAARRLDALGADFDLHLVGWCDSKGYADRLRADIERFGLTGKVHLVGELAPEQVRRELSEAACLVLASFQETAPMVVGEAMAVGVPIVGTRVGGLPYMIEDGKTGYVVDTDDMDGFAERVGRVLESASLRRSFGERAAQIARERFRPQVVAAKTRQVYYAAAGRPLPTGGGQADG